ncbi:MAG: hypothetical protein AABY22_03170 [Nanoarchaeota archaeon]
MNYRNIVICLGLLLVLGCSDLGASDLAIIRTYRRDRTEWVEYIIERDDLNCTDFGNWKYFSRKTFNKPECNLANSRVPCEFSFARNYTINTEHCKLYSGDKVFVYFE